MLEPITSLGVAGIALLAFLVVDILGLSYLLPQVVGTIVDNA